jgi:hypothetical protein
MRRPTSRLWAASSLAEASGCSRVALNNPDQGLERPVTWSHSSLAATALWVMPHFLNPAAGKQGSLFLDGARRHP